MGGVGKIFVWEFAQHDVLCCDLNLFVVHASPRPRSTNFRVAKRSLVYFLQHESLLREEVEIHATNTQLTTRTTLVARQVARKCCFLTWPINRELKVFTKATEEACGQLWGTARFDSHQRRCKNFICEFAPASRKKLVFNLSLLIEISCGYNQCKLKGPIFSGIKDFAKLLKGEYSSLFIDKVYWVAIVWTVPEIGQVRQTTRRCL